MLSVLSYTDVHCEAISDTLFVHLAHYSVHPLLMKQNCVVWLAVIDAAVYWCTSPDHLHNDNM